MPILIQRTGLVGDAVQVSPHIIKGIGHVRKQNRLVAVEEGHKCHRKDIIRSHSHKHLLRLDMIILCQCVNQRGGILIRVQTQAAYIQSLGKCLNSRCRGIRTFIRIQFDHIWLIGLFPGHIRNYFSNILFEFHLSILLPVILFRLECLRLLWQIHCPYILNSTMIPK